MDDGCTVGCMCGWRTYLWSRRTVWPWYSNVSRETLPKKKYKTKPNKKKQSSCWAAADTCFCEIAKDFQGERVADSCQEEGWGVCLALWVEVQKPESAAWWIATEQREPERLQAHLPWLIIRYRQKKRSDRLFRRPATAECSGSLILNARAGQADHHLCLTKHKVAFELAKGDARLGALRDVMSKMLQVQVEFWYRYLNIPSCNIGGRRETATSVGSLKSHRKVFFHILRCCFLRTGALWGQESKRPDWFIVFTENQNNPNPKTFLKLHFLNVDAWTLKDISSVQTTLF